MHRHVLSDFAKSDKVWLGPLLVSVADNAPLLAAGDDSTFMNKVSIALGSQDKADDGRKAGKAKD